MKFVWEICSFPKREIFNSDRSIQWQKRHRLCSSICGINIIVYFDNYMEFKEKLEFLLNRHIDFLENQAIRNPIFKMKMHFAVVFCLFTYDFFTEINSSHSQADYFWLTKSCKSFYYRLQENHNRSKCFDFECIKRVE